MGSDLLIVINCDLSRLLKFLSFLFEQNIFWRSGDQSSYKGYEIKALVIKDIDTRNPYLLYRSG